MYHTHMVILILETNSLFKKIFQKWFYVHLFITCVCFFLIHVLHSITCVCLSLYFINKFVYIMKYTECSDLINERRHIPITWFAAITVLTTVNKCYIYYVSFCVWNITVMEKKNCKYIFKSNLIHVLFVFLCL